MKTIEVSFYHDPNDQMQDSFVNREIRRDKLIRALAKIIYDLGDHDNEEIENFLKQTHITISIGPKP